MQIKDVMFAGTDTTGTNLAHLIWQLTQNPHIYTQLRHEIDAYEAQLPPRDDPSILIPSPLPAFPDPLPRSRRQREPPHQPRQRDSIPADRPLHQLHLHYHPSPLLFSSSHLPPPRQHHRRTLPCTLHFNPLVYPDPHTFDPSRWLPAAHPSAEMLRDWIPFGVGARQCIARNLAMQELQLATYAIVKGGVLEGARVGGGNEEEGEVKWEMMEWFNARVKGGKVEVWW